VGRSENFVLFEGCGEGGGLEEKIFKGKERLQRGSKGKGRMRAPWGDNQCKRFGEVEWGAGGEKNRIFDRPYVRRLTEPTLLKVQLVGRLPKKRRKKTWERLGRGLSQVVLGGDG